MICTKSQKFARQMETFQNRASKRSFLQAQIGDNYAGGSVFFQFKKIVFYVKIDSISICFGVAL